MKKIFDIIKSLRPKAFENFLLVFPLLREYYLESQTESAYLTIFADHMEALRAKNMPEDQDLKGLIEALRTDPSLNQILLKKEKEILHSFTHPKNGNVSNNPSINEYLNQLPRERTNKPV